MRIPFKKAQEIHEMTTRKNIHSKTMDTEKVEEEMLLSPKLYEYAKQVKKKMKMVLFDRVDWDNFVIEIPKEDKDYEENSDETPPKK